MCKLLHFHILFYNVFCREFLPSQKNRYSINRPKVNDLSLENSMLIFFCKCLGKRSPYWISFSLASFLFSLFIARLVLAEILMKITRMHGLQDSLVYTSEIFIDFFFLLYLSCSSRRIDKLQLIMEQPRILHN